MRHLALGLPGEVGLAHAVMLVDIITDLLRRLQVAPSWVEPLANLFGLIVLLSIAWLAQRLARRIVLHVVVSLVERSAADWDDALLRAGVFARLAHLAPAVVIKLLGDEVFTRTARLVSTFDKLVAIYIVIVVMLVINAMLDAAIDYYNRKSTTRRVPLRGFAQGGKLVTFLVSLVVMLSVLLGRSPVYLLSGLGALTAVLVVLFKDALLGLVAGVQLSVNRLVQIGDWIEMAKYGADGAIIDVGLTTVKVQNWDMTITTVPTYALISDPVKNWRGMIESGGRRIKRAIFLDVTSFRFLDDSLLDRLSTFRRLAPYLESRRLEVAAHNRERQEDLRVLANGRRLTNIGCFRAYVNAYLREHSGIHQQMMVLVRQLEATDRGLPLEIYAFTADTSWAAHEGVQADIFDHLLTLVPEFELRLFQSPTGSDLRALGAGDERATPASSRTFALRSEA
jgi:miniconductance mechanosensitive channel